MSDFEVHDRGTAEELRLSRALAGQIEQVIQSYSPGILPHNVINAYNKLYEFYIRQMENE